MISDQTREAIAKAAAPRLTQPKPVAADPPVEFLVKSAMYFAGERAEPGAVIRVPMPEAISLVGNHHAELVHPEDAARVRDASRRMVYEETKTAHPRDRFVDRYVRT